MSYLYALYPVAKKLINLNNNNEYFIKDIRSFNVVRGKEVTLYFKNNEILTIVKDNISDSGFDYLVHLF